MFNFKRLVKRYSKTSPMLKVESEGYYDYENGGVWVDGFVEWIEFEGAIVPLGESVMFDNARYTTDDRKLYTYQDIKEGSQIRYLERAYTAMEIKDYGEYDDDLKIIILKAGGTND